MVLLCCYPEKRNLKRRVLAVACAKFHEGMIVHSFKLRRPRPSRERAANPAEPSKQEPRSNFGDPELPWRASKRRREVHVWQL